MRFPRFSLRARLERSGFSCRLRRRRKSATGLRTWRSGLAAPLLPSGRRADRAANKGGERIDDEETDIGRDESDGRDRLRAGAGSPFPDAAGSDPEGAAEAGGRTRDGSGDAPVPAFAGG